MLKKDLIELNARLRAENSALRTQLEAAKTPARTPADPNAAQLKAACARLHARYPNRRSFTGEEVRQECSA